MTLLAGRVPSPKDITLRQENYAINYNFSKLLFVILMGGEKAQWLPWVHGRHKLFVLTLTICSTN
jgi:hypothetical protein